MEKFKINAGAVVGASRYEEGFADYIYCRSDGIFTEAVGFVIQIKNVSQSRFVIDNIIFRLGTGGGVYDLVPIYSDRGKSYPFKMPAPIGPCFAVDYELPLEIIPLLICRAKGLVVKYRNYYNLFPAYNYQEHKDERFELFIRILKFKCER